MGIGDNSRLAVQITQNQVGGLASHAGDFEQLCHGPRYFSLMVVQQVLGSGMQVTGFGFTQTAGSDHGFDFLRLRLGKGFQGREEAVQILGDNIYPLIRTLGRQPGSKQQFIILLILQGTDGIRIFLLKQSDSSFRPFLWCQHHGKLL